MVRKRADITPIDPGSGDVRPRIDIRRPLKGESLALWPLESQVTWYLIHYDGKHSVPCLRDRCFCLRSEMPVDVRREGWLLAVEARRTSVVLASVTFGAWQTCEALRDKEIDLRACELILTRGAHRTNAPVTAAVVRNHHPTSRVPVVPYTHLDLLLRVWYPRGSSYTEFNAAVESSETLGSVIPDGATIAPQGTEGGGA